MRPIGTFLFIVLQLSVRVYATDVWIHAVGINETRVQQNYGSFYKSAQDFENQCASSNKKPECILFLNNSPKLRAYDEANSFKLPHNQGSPTAKSLKKLISEKLENAKSGDTLVISLQNHGAPVSGQSPACIWLSASDFICENDLKNILLKKPAGVKVFINADSCFSGAFAELATSEICTASMSDRLNFGRMGRRNLWNSVLERHPQNLSDLSEPIFNESGTERLLGSQLMLQQLCQGARKKNGSKLSVSNLSFVANLPILDNPKDCRDVDLTSGKLAAVAKQVFSVLAKSAQPCESLNLPKPVCDASGRIMRSDSSIKKNIHELEMIANKEMEIGSWVGKNAAAISINARKVKEQMRHLSAGEIYELSDSFALGQEPQWGKFSKKNLSIAKNVWDQSKGFTYAIRDANQLKKQTDAIIIKLKKSKTYEDLLTVQNCLFENQPETIAGQKNKEDAETLQYSRSIANQFPQKKFTINDYEDARKCEASIRF